MNVMILKRFAPIDQNPLELVKAGKISGAAVLRISN